MDISTLAVIRLEELGRRGFVISIVYGPCGRGGDLLYSVDVLTSDGRSFEKPYAAISFVQAVKIAEKEIDERGWWE